MRLAQYGSLADLLKTLPQSVGEGRVTDQEWCGFTPADNVKTSGQALNLVKNGWHDGAERIAREVESLDAPSARVVRRRGTWGPQGDTVDMQRVYGGALDLAWRRMLPVNVSGPRRVRLVADVGARSNVTSESMFWRGAALAKLADVFVTAGYAVEILSANVANNASKPGGPDHLVSVVVKDSSAPIDPSAVAALTALPWFKRGLLIPWFKKQYGGDPSSHGITESPEALEALQAPGTLLIVVPHSVRTQAQASTWCKEQVEALDAAAVA